MEEEKKDKTETAEKEPVVVTEEVKVRPLRKAAQEKYPDFAPENDSDWDEKEDEVFTSLADDNKTYRDAEAKLDEIIATDPELADVLNDMVVDKTPFRVAIAKHYSQEDLIPVEGEEDFEAYQSAFNERVNRKKARDERDAQIMKNEEESLNAIDTFAEENGMDEEGKKNFIGFINDIFSEMLYKKLTPQTLSAFYNAMNHDADVADAAEAAEIKGRNAKIEADMAEEEAEEIGDGMPDLSTKGGSIDDAAPSQPTMLDDIVSRRKF